MVSSDPPFQVWMCITWYSVEQISGPPSEGGDIFVGGIHNRCLRYLPQSNLYGQKWGGTEGCHSGPEGGGRSPASTSSNAGQSEGAGFSICFWKYNQAPHLWMVSARNQSLLKIVLLMTCLRNVTSHCNKLPSYLKPPTSCFKGRK